MCLLFRFLNARVYSGRVGGVFALKGDIWPLGWHGTRVLHVVHRDRSPIIVLRIPRSPFPRILFSNDPRYRIWTLIVFMSSNKYIQIVFFFQNFEFMISKLYLRRLQEKNRIRNTAFWICLVAAYVGAVYINIFCRDAFTVTTYEALYADICQEAYRTYLCHT